MGVEVKVERIKGKLPLDEQREDSTNEIGKKRRKKKMLEFLLICSLLFMFVVRFSRGLPASLSHGYNDFIPKGVRGPARPGLDPCQRSSGRNWT